MTPADCWKLRQMGSHELWSTFFLTVHCFTSFVPIATSKLGRQSCRVACLLISVSVGYHTVQPRGKSRGLQGDVVNLSWPIAPLVLWAQMRGKRGVAGSQPLRTAVHITWHEAHINFGDEDLPQLVVDSLVLPDANPGHLLEYPLAPEYLQAVDLQLRVPDVLQALRGLVYLLNNQLDIHILYNKRPQCLKFTIGIKQRMILWILVK